MFRRVIAGLILGPALLIGSFAWSGYLALQTVFDEDRSETIARELLDNELVREQLAENLASVIGKALPDGAPVTEDQIDTAALAVLDDPRVTNLVIDSFGSTHRAFLGQGDVPQTLDLNSLADLAREQVARIAPGAADALPADTDWTVELPTERIPDSSPVKSFLETSVPYLAGISLVMVALAFLTTSDRPSVLRRAAFWAIGTTAFYLIVGLGLPALLRRLAPAQAEVFAALLTALLRTTLVPSIVLGAVGAGLLVASWVWPDGRREPKPRRAAAPAPAPAPVAAPAPAAAPSARRAPEPVAYDRRAAAAAGPSSSPATPTGTASSLAAPSPRPAPAQPPTTHVPPVRPQASAPPQQPVTPPSTPVVPAQPSPSPQRNTPPGTPSPSAWAPADPTTGTQPLVTGPTSSLAPPGTPPPTADPPPARPTLPTRAAPGDAVSLPSWTGDLTPTPPAGDPRSRPPRWVDGHGWVLDPEDERAIPSNARYVEGVGYVVPGPPPRS